MRVAMTLYAGVQLLDVAGPMDVFHEANRLCGNRFYEMHLIGPSHEPVVCSNGARLIVAESFADARCPFDILIVPGSPAIRSGREYRRVQHWVSKVGRDTPRVASVCSGAFLLAATGLADDRSVTTHWRDALRLSAEFPAVHVKADMLCVRDGNIYSSGGVTAGIDLAMAIVAEDLGEMTARNVAKALLTPRYRSGTQRQFGEFNEDKSRH